MATLIGTAGRDRLTGTAGDDTLSGLGEKDTLLGLGGNDLLDGGLGADTLTGGLGNDVYRIDNRNDRAVELAGEGVDRIESTVAFALPANVEDLTLQGIARLNGVGNDLDNTIIGNAERNALSGLGGDDRLEGGAGADRLDGGTGADTLVGGAGNDGYTLDNAGDSIVELAGGGFEQVTTAMSFTLPDNVERLTLSGTGDLDGAGNAVNNIVRGTSGDNVLQGLGGRDTLFGFGGNDLLDGGTGADNRHLRLYDERRPWRQRLGYGDGDHHRRERRADRDDRQRVDHRERERDHRRAGKRRRSRHGRRADGVRDFLRGVGRGDDKRRQHAHLRSGHGVRFSCRRRDRDGNLHVYGARRPRRPRLGERHGDRRRRDRRAADRAGTDARRAKWRERLPPGRRGAARLQRRRGIRCRRCQR